MNKQIEEMAKIKRVLIKTCKRVRNAQEDYMQDRYAEALYNEGYRKQSEGEWIEDGYNGNPCVCSKCGAESQYVSKFHETFEYDWEENLQSAGYEEIRDYIRTPYCPECGAKMKIV